jgi:hypothetical protein
MSPPGGSVNLLSDQQVDTIAARLAERLAGKPAGGTQIPAPPVAPVAAPRAALGEGVFATVDDAVEAANVAFRKFDGVSLEARQKIIASIRESMFEHAEELGNLAHRETGLGRPEHKLIKNRLVTRKTSGTEVLVPQAVTGDNGLTLTEYAPYGVIGAITPTTNPTSTIICNTIAMLSAGNSIVFNVHPNARECSMANIRLLHRAITRAGGPDNLVSAVAEPTIESAQELMGHKGVRILTVTGGSGVVRQAMTSGKRAICAGPGNPPVVVDDTADLEHAGRCIVAGASFDNNIVCTDEKEVIAVESVVDELIQKMCKHGAFLVNERDLHKLERAIFSEYREGPYRQERGRDSHPGRHFVSWRPVTRGCTSLEQSSAGLDGADDAGDAGHIGTQRRTRYRTGEGSGTRLRPFGRHVLARHRRAEQDGADDQHEHFYEERSVLCGPGRRRRGAQ